LHPDLDHIEDLSMKESAEPAPRAEQGTHISSKSRERKDAGLEAWNIIVEAHVEKTKAVYGLPPLAPDLKRDQRQALAESLDGAATEVRAKLHARTGIEQDIVEVQRTLAMRVMQLYFKRDNEHLRRVKHALRDLPREFHARITEAMQLVLRESHDATPPRRVQVEQAPECVESADKPAEVTAAKAPERIESVDKPVEVATAKAPECVESVDKPVEVVASKAPDSASPPHAASPQASMDTAREARRILEALNAKSPQQELSKPSNPEAQVPAQPTRPTLREWMRVELEQARASVDKPSQDKPTRTSFEDKPSPTPPSGRGDLHHAGLPAARVPGPEVQRAVLLRRHLVADHRRRHDGLLGPGAELRDEPAV
jgi:hypothetical protein